MKNRIEILADMQEIFRDIFDDDGLVIGPATSAKDVDEWDSIAHMDIVLSVERHFNVKFRPEEIAALRNVGDLVQLVEDRQA